MWNTEEYVLGVDNGSGGCKVTCLDSRGRVASEAFSSYPSYTPLPGWVEQDPEDWVSGAGLAMAGALAQLSRRARANLVGIAFSAPHHVAVLLDANGNVVRHAIMWNDQRSRQEARELDEAHGQRIFSLTNNRSTATWTLSHLRWLRGHEPWVFESVKHVLFMKDFVRYRFCGEMSTDYIDAAGSLMFDIHNHAWAEELCNLIPLGVETLPPIVAPIDVVGELGADWSERLGVPLGVPIIAGTADTAAEIYGCGAVEPGSGIVKLATAGNVSIVSDSLPEDPSILTYEHVVPGRYYQNSGTNSGASSFRWFAESFYRDAAAGSMEEKYQLMDREVASVGAGAGGIIFHPYLNGERAPYWDGDLRASFFGISVRHDRGNFVRAVMEGVAFSLRDARSVYGGLLADHFRITGGGSRSPAWCQIVSDVLNVELEVPKHSDSSFGACLIAATAVGWYGNAVEAIRSVVDSSTQFRPIPGNALAYSSLFEIYTDLQRQTVNSSHRLAEFERRVVAGSLKGDD